MISREDAQKLLGGYATGTLTPEEQQALFEAALHDQDLFDALAREQSLRDLLADPASRNHLLATIDEARIPWYRRWLKPAPIAVLATALALIAFFVVRQPSRPTLVAKVDLPAPVQPAPVPAPPAVTLEQAPPTPPASTPRASKPVESLRDAAQIAAAPTPPPAPARAFDQAAAGKKEPVIVTAGSSFAAPPTAAAPPIATPQELARVQAEKQLKAQIDSIAIQKTDVQPIINNAVQNKSLNAAQNIQLPASPPPIQQFVQNQNAGDVAQFKSVVAPAAPDLAFMYRVVTKLPNGENVEVDPAIGVAAGTPINLQITPSENGYLQVLQSEPGGVWREIVNRQVESMQQFETGPMQFDASGRREIYVSFSRNPLASRTVPPNDKDLRTVTSNGTAGSGAVLGGSPMGFGAGLAGGGGGKGGAAAKNKKSSAAPSDRDRPATQLISILIALNVR